MTAVSPTRRRPSRRSFPRWKRTAPGECPAISSSRIRTYGIVVEPCHLWALSASHRQTMPDKTRPRLLIVGGGFGGLKAAEALAHLPVQITVVDRKNHHTFQPL